VASLVVGRRLDHDRLRLPLRATTLAASLPLT
jgi:hypothetical protein